MYAQNHSLLILNDEPYILRTLAAQMAAGYEIRASDCLKAAQAVPTRHRVKEILTDLQAPCRTGIQLLEDLCRNPWRRPLVF